MRTKVEVLNDCLQITMPKQVMTELGWVHGQELDVSVHGNAVLLNSIAQQPASLGRLVTLVHMEALELFEGDQMAKERWMESRIPILGHRTPYEMLHSAADIESLRLVINRLDHGSFP